MSEKRNLDDLQAFPVLTHETDGMAARRAGMPGASLAQSIEQQLYTILGWRPRISDVKGFVAALSQSFTSKEEKGITVWEWMPHTYAIRADLGAVTGAQASIYKQAKVILDESIPLLEGFTPLRPCADEENAEASRAIVESQLTELVEELGYVGGPRVQRVDTLFAILLGQDPDLGGPENVKGQLGRLRERFGFDRSQVTTVEEEQKLTNFLVLVDYVQSLKRTWDAQERFFDRSGKDVFLGTHLVLVSRALATLLEAVYETRDAMDSVWLGEAERQTIPLPFEGEDGPSLTIAELLSWAEHCASVEGPRLIREGGKDGVRAFLPTAERLSSLITKVRELCEEGQNPVPGFHTPRVRAALKGLERYAAEVVKLAEEIAAPALQIESVNPDSGFCGHTVWVNIRGEAFEGGSEAEFGADIAIEDMLFLGPRWLLVKIGISSRAEGGPRNVTVTNPDGQSSILKDGFRVLPPEEYTPAGPEPTSSPLRCRDIDLRRALKSKGPSLTAKAGRKTTVKLQQGLQDWRYVCAVFDRNLDGDRLSSDSFKVVRLVESGEEPVKGEVGLHAPRIAYFEPKAPESFKPGTYKITLLGDPDRPAITDVEGCPLEATIEYEFEVAEEGETLAARSSA